MFQHIDPGALLIVETVPFRRKAAKSNTSCPFVCHALGLDAAQPKEDDRELEKAESD
jgi:hypothetical protein